MTTQSPSTKPYFSEGSEAMLVLEAMVDKVGLANVVYALAFIARMKANHVHEAWQDRGLAAAWDNDAGRLDAIAGRLHGH